MMNRMKNFAQDVHDDLIKQKSVKTYFAEKIQNTNPFYLNPVFTIVEDCNSRMTKYYSENFNKLEKSEKVIKIFHLFKKKFSFQKKKMKFFLRFFSK